MTKVNKLSRLLLSSLAVLFVAVANMTAPTYCWSLWGETKCPKSLLK